MLDNFINRIIKGDCLEEMKEFPAKSINMVLCDLPYGTTCNKWDSVISLGKLWEEYFSILCVRHPIERLISSYLYHCKGNYTGYF